MVFMDSLFKRYADPFSLLNGYIATGRLSEFINTFAKCKLEDDRWEFYIHRVWDKSWDDYKADLENTWNNQTLSKDEIETTVNMVADIMKNFKPEGGGQVEPV